MFRDEGVPLDTTALLDLAGVGFDEDTLGPMLDRVTRIAARTLPGPSEVSLTVLAPEGPLLTAATGALARKAVRVEYARRQGPALDVTRTGRALRVDNLRAEDRWPHYIRACRGVGSSLSVPLPATDGYTGALTWYSRRVRAFPDGYVRAALTVGSCAAVALHSARGLVAARTLARQLGEAMATRAVIEQAKGILIQQRGCAPDEAFEVLVRVSQRTNTKLRLVATEMVQNAAHGNR
ncbi:MAG TPA: GAF and ANTAR domain-containing protein [Mycobacteriales bacterium]